MPPLPPSPLTFDSAKDWVINLTFTTHKEYWELHAPQSYQDLEIKFRLGCPAELSLPRQHVAHIYAARSGHGDFASYHTRFNHDSAHKTCCCGKLKSARHFLYRRLATLRLPKPPKKSSDKIKFLLGTFTGASKLVQWFDKTNFFTEICSKQPQNRQQ